MTSATGSLVAASTMAAVLFVACGRSDNPVSGTGPRLSVSTTAASIGPGAGGLRVSVVISNLPIGEPQEIRDCGLIYAGTGTGFWARRTTTLPQVVDGSSMTVEFVARMPPDAEGSGRIDAFAYGGPVGGDSWDVGQAQSPLDFPFVAPAPRDFGALPVLTVTTELDEESGGTDIVSPADPGVAELSLREALTIIDNTGVPHRIVFALPAASTIVVDALGELPWVVVAGTVIDGLPGTIRLELFEWEDPSITVTATDVVLRGLEIIGPNAYPLLNAVAAHDLEISDCAFTDTLGYGDADIALHASHRVVVRRVRSAGREWRAVVRAFGSDDLLVEDTETSFLYIENGAAPVVQRVNFTRHASLDLWDTPGALVRENTFSFSDCDQAIEIAGPPGCGGVILEANWMAGAWCSGTPPIAVVSVDTCGAVTISRNDIRGDFGPAIELLSGANGGIEVPTIDSATSSTVAGTAPGVPDGTAELFADEAGELAGFVGTTAVVGGAFSFTGLTLAPGTNVRVTVTDLQGNTSEGSVAVAVP